MLILKAHGKKPLMLRSEQRVCAVSEHKVGGWDQSQQVNHETTVSTGQDPKADGRQFSRSEKKNLQIII